MQKKYEFTGETKVWCGITLHRIRAAIDFTLRSGIKVTKGEEGGWIEKEENLSHAGSAWVCGNAEVYGDAEVERISDVIWFKNIWSSGRTFTYTHSNRKWAVGRFYGTGEELIKKAYADSKVSGHCYEAIVRATEEIYRAMEEKEVGK